MNYSRVFFVLFCLMVTFSSYTYRKISSRSLKKVERKCRVATIAFGHDTIGEVKVPNLRFESHKYLTPEQSLAQFKSIYWEVMCRTSPCPEQPTIANIVLPGGKSGASIMVSYTSADPRIERIYKPYASMTSVHPNGRVIVYTYNRDTEKFEKVIETSLAILFGLEGSSEEAPSCKLAHTAD